MSVLSAERVVVAGRARPRLDGVDVTLSGGEVVALVGPNGSGKTTLLRALAGAEPLAGGRVTLDGVPLDVLGARARAQKLTMVAHAAPVDFALTVRDVVALGRLPHLGAFGVAGARDDERVAHALDATDLTRLADRELSTLSAGEQQRAHLARALAQEVSALLLDEPTANLDLRHKLEALELVRAFAARGGGALVAIHDLDLAARAADRLIVLHEGRVFAAGSPEDVLDSMLFEAVFGVEGRLVRDDAGLHVRLKGPDRREKDERA